MLLKKKNYLEMSENIIFKIENLLLHVKSENNLQFQRLKNQYSY